MKQKVLGIGERFTIKDEQENDIYYMEGSFMKIPKTFLIMNIMKDEIAHITKEHLASYRNFM